jgi:hypothetical protein
MLDAPLSRLFSYINQLVDSQMTYIGKAPPRQWGRAAHHVYNLAPVDTAFAAKYRQRSLRMQARGRRRSLEGRAVQSQIHGDEHDVTANLFFCDVCSVYLPSDHFLRKAHLREHRSIYRASVRAHQRRVRMGHVSPRNYRQVSPVQAGWVTADVLTVTVRIVRRS